MKYWKYEWKNLVFFLGILLSVWVVWSAYNYPMEAAAYISAIATTIFVIVEGIRWFQEKENAGEITKGIEDADSCFRKLPKPMSALEEKYQQLAQVLNEKNIRIQAKEDQKQLNMRNYYSMWSHQIKTPIAGIQLLLQEDEIDGAAIRREVHRIEQYVDTTLWYQRMNGVDNDFVLKDIALEQVVKETLKRNVSLLMRPGVKIQLDLHPYHVVSDKKWLGFVLEQLLSNAVKYTREGSVTVRMDQVEQKVLLSIEDTGIGIRNEDLPRIFEWGYTGLNGHDNKKSTGIGLALCKEAIDRLGHIIYIESAQGAGTKVTIEMNLATVDLRD